MLRVMLFGVALHEEYFIAMLEAEKFETRISLACSVDINICTIFYLILPFTIIIIFINIYGLNVTCFSFNFLVYTHRL